MTNKTTCIKGAYLDRRLVEEDAEEKRVYNRHVLSLATMRTTTTLTTLSSLSMKGPLEVTFLEMRTMTTTTITMTTTEMITTTNSR